MDFVVIQAALIFLPGIIWANIDSTYVANRPLNQTQMLIKAFVLGLATYAILFLIYVSFGRNFYYKAFSDTSKIDVGSFFDEILLSIPTALGLSVAWLYFQNYRCLTRVLHLIKATKRFGNQDVWTFTLNSGQPYVEYVNIRDLERGYTFSGFVNSFSEREDVK